MDHLNHYIINLVIEITLFVVGLMLFKKWATANRKKHQEYDELIIKRAVSEVIPGAEFFRELCMEPSVLNGFGIIPYYDKYREKGMIRYKMGEKNYVFSNIHLLRASSSQNGGKNYRTIYEGQAYTAHYKTSLPGRVRIITTKRFLNNEVNVGYPSKRKGETKIETENIQFNDNFDVFATDEQSAFFVLNPVVMEQLLEMKQRFEEVGVFVGGETMAITLKTNNFLFPEGNYNEQQALITLENTKDEVRSMLRMTELLEDTINGSIENNFTVRS